MSNLHKKYSREDFELELNNAGKNSISGQIEHGSILSGRYKILECVGRGGMGAVYKAADLRLNSTIVAVKEMLNYVSNPEKMDEAVEGFKKEANMLVGLRHKALPRVTDFFSQEGKWFLIMDFIEGETLQQVLDKRGMIPEDDVVNWFYQLVDVFNYLHNHKPAIIFRDLKPSNVMLTQDNEIKLIDFGIARHFNPINVQDTELYVSTGFSPPEQYGWTQTNPQSDIYALGALLHCLLTGIDPRKNPFNFVQPQSVVEVSDKLSDAIMKAVEYNQEDRPKSVQDMLNIYLGSSAENEDTQVKGSTFLQKLLNLIGLEVDTDEEDNKDDKDSFSKLPILLSVVVILLAIVFLTSLTKVISSNLADKIGLTGLLYGKQSTPTGSQFPADSISNGGESDNSEESKDSSAEPSLDSSSFMAGDVLQSFERDLNNDNVMEKVSVEYASPSSVYLCIDGKRNEIFLPKEGAPYNFYLEMHRDLMLLDSVPEEDSENEEIILAIHMATADRGAILVFAGGFNYKGEQLWSFDADYPLPKFEIDYKGNRVVNINIPDYGVESNYIYVHTDYSNIDYEDYDFKKIFSNVGQGQNLCKVIEYANFLVDDFDRNGEKEIETVGGLWYYYKGDYLHLCNLVTRYMIKNEQLTPVEYIIKSFDE